MERAVVARRGGLVAGERGSGGRGQGSAQLAQQPLPAVPPHRHRGSAVRG